ncbi:MAG: DUF934 domain-containing protein [Casimicrobiaceae bacterium]
MAKLIRHNRVVEDDWTLLPASANAVDAAAQPRVIVPLALWRSDDGSLRARGDVGVWLGPADDPELIAADTAHLPVIAIAFPQFGDGRGFSTGRLLRERHRFEGELRAFGDVFQDQLFFLAECGFDAFEVRIGLDPDQELRGLAAFTRTYTHGLQHPRPWFRDRTSPPRHSES